MVDPTTDADIARDWPERWARANDPSLRGRSKARNNLRKAYRGWRALAEFMQANPTASCLTCKNRVKMPLDDRYYCAEDSDFHGYSVLTSNNPCLNYSENDNG